MLTSVSTRAKARQLDRTIEAARMCCAARDEPLLIGIACCDRTMYKALCAGLIDAGHNPLDIRRILHPNDASEVRWRGGLVVHVEAHPRPSFCAHITSAGFDCLPGDYVLQLATDPAECVPRLVRDVAYFEKVKTG